MSLLDEKYMKLSEILLRYKRVAVAFSGGIDSTFLLYSAIDVLGSENVVAYTCVSEVNTESGLSNMRRVFQNHFSSGMSLQEIHLHPLTWEDFVINNDKRCYICKKRMYTIILDELEKENCSNLLDGTNVDDLKKNRPGLKAIEELNIHTPLVEAGLTKQEIRTLAKSKGLINHNLPSNSCLATRIATGVEITQNQLHIIEVAEKYLHKLGYAGCRVKVDGDTAYIELCRNDFVTFVDNDVKNAVLEKFYHLGLIKVLLNLTSR